MWVSVWVSRCVGAWVWWCLGVFFLLVLVCHCFWVPACLPALGAYLPALGACLRSLIRQNSLLSSFSVRSELIVSHNASALAQEAATRIPKWKDLGPLRLPCPTSRWRRAPSGGSGEGRT